MSLVFAIRSARAPLSPFGYHVQEWKLGPDGPPLRSSIFIPWFKLQCALVSTWEAAPQGLVLGKALESIEQEKAGATLTFKVCREQA